LSTIPTHFDIPRTTYWILGFTIIHAMMAFLFMTRLGWISRVCILAGLVLLLYANAMILKDKSPDTTLKVLPCFHIAMVLYAGGIATGAFF
jgi:4-hydroxybenzoate polyprenyltransferase